MTAAEIRERILASVAANGGHLASSLGAVELCMALAEAFDPARDRVVWDVGHQAYAWKILTGRAEAFGTLRRLDGLSGFPNPAESPCDAAVAGHAGVALSVAEGYAAARRLTGADYHVVAVTGDSSLVNGTSFEALNNCAAAGKVILVLNDNGMSISKPAGSFSRFLGRLIAGARYNRVKNAARRVGRAMRLYFLYGVAHRFKARVKSWFLADAFFEQFGFRYLGPVDGHDVAALKAAFAVAKEDPRSVIVHVVTKKGKGYAPAEKDPTRWHGVGPGAVRNEEGTRDQGLGTRGGQEVPRPFRAEDKILSAAQAGAAIRAAQAERKRVPSASAPSPQSLVPSPSTWSDSFGAALCAAAEKDGRIVALTAGMKDGTGLAAFAEKFPARFYDVGIAEGHMVAFAAGLAAAGLRPVVAVYSTFLQRAVDQVMHDVCLANLPVVFCVDRAGVVGADGVTHQGLYDIAMLRCLPNLTIAQPKDADDLAALLDEALSRPGPTVIRYPRGIAARVANVECRMKNEELGVGRLGWPRTMCEAQAVAPSYSSFFILHSSLAEPTTAVWATGDWYERARRVAEAVGGVAVHARYLKPFDAELLRRQREAGMRIVSLENGAVAGGFGEAIGADVKFGWPDAFIPHGTPAELEARYGLDEAAIIARLRDSAARTNAAPSQPRT